MPECAREFFMLNGELLPVSLFDRHFSPPAFYSYEVFRTDEGVALFLEDHLERFFATARLAGFNPAMDGKGTQELIYRLIRKNSPGEGNIKIAAYPGRDGKLQIFIYFVVHSYPTAEQFRNGVKVDLFHAERENPNAKVMNVRLRKETDTIKENQEVYEVLLVDRNGFITEGSRSNVFFIRNNCLITPPSGTVLMGITRKQIMEMCSENDIPVLEKQVHHSEIGSFEGLFISGTSRRVLPVMQAGEQMLPPVPALVYRLQLLFEQRVKLYIALFRQQS
ncbi:MAG TPA: aminotransferase class IV [Lentimicrobium sp.]|nr:aminotransferase class IV [Lentimicrobium sp.]